MSSRSRHRHTARQQIARLYRRHRPMILTFFAAAVAVVGALIIFTRFGGG